MNIYFGENLKEQRQKKNLTQEKLADYLGVSFQTISKWERGETYPDICTLPEIAGFFKISVDDLLGVNKAENEAEIVKQITAYDNLSDYKLMWKLISSLKERFPNDFRVMVRYIACLAVAFLPTQEREAELMSVYENIQQNCTDDSIRITAKRAIIAFYHSMTDNGEKSFEICESIINQMPRMRDSREMFSFYYPESHPQYRENIIKALEEEFLLLDTTLSHLYLFNDEYDTDFKIELLKKENEWLEFIYDDGNFGKMWLVVMYNYGYLGVQYFKKGDTDNALLNFKKSAELAKQFDELDKTTFLNSTLFKGKEFNKDTLGSTHIAKNRIKTLLTERYPLSDEFKSTKEFDEILKILE